ncbi:MAG: exosortase family protein XrtF [Bacteroidia bacterium]|nr:exosortase family protein XrtF [Bacteroidia bacterium]
MTPALKFIFKFIGLYALLQVIYIFYLWRFEPTIDPVSLWIAEALTTLFSNSSLLVMPEFAKVQFLLNGKAIINIKEACNGISVVIVFISFVLAYGKLQKKHWVYISLGTIFLAIANLFRIYALVQIKVNFPDQFAFFHEYIFPIILYLIAFGMMFFWVRKNNKLV